MTGIPLRVTLGALLAIVIAVAVAFGVRLSSRSPSRTNQATTGRQSTGQAATEQTTKGQAMTSGQLVAVLPRQAGGLRLENAAPGPRGYGVVPLPECFGATFTANGTAPKSLPKLYSDIDEPIASGRYSSQNYGFNIELFRFNQSKLPEVAQLIMTAPAHCTQVRLLNTTVDVNVRLDLPLGEENAAYQTYLGASADKTNIRSPENINLVVLSKGWGLTVSTNNSWGDVREAMKEVSLTAQYLPDLLRQLDQVLQTSFRSANGNTAALAFPDPMPYIAQNYSSASPAFGPTNYWVSRDSTLDLANLQWSSWTAHMAVASGIAKVNSCVPNCAGGKWQDYPVQVSLSNPQYACQFPFFGRLQLHWPGEKPSGNSGDETFQILPDC